MALLVVGGELRAVEGQKAGRADFAFQPVFHVGIYDIDLFELARVVCVQKDGRDLARTLHGGILRRVEKAPADGDIVALVVLPPVFAHDEELLLADFLFGKFLRRLDDVLIIRAREPLVRRDDEHPHRSALREFPLQRIEVAVLDALVGAEDALDLRLQRGEIGARSVQPLFGFAHFGGGDEIHRLSDLLRILNARDVRFDLLYAGHCAFAPSCRHSERNSSASAQILSRSSGDILPVSSMLLHSSCACTSK